MSQALENLLTEDRKFEPSPEFAAKAKAKPGIHEDAADDYLEFWHRQALQRITWHKEPTQVLDDSNPPFFKWFADGELNISFNCLDRHLGEHGAQAAPKVHGEVGVPLRHLPLEHAGPQQRSNQQGQRDDQEEEDAADHEEPTGHRVFWADHTGGSALW